MSEPSPAEAIFFAALEQATAVERAAFLDEACAGDERLRRRVEGLLAAHEQAGDIDFLGRPVAGAANLGAADLAATPLPETGETLDFLAPSERPGALGRLGHYEVLEVVGRGGMGIVLRAFDDKLHRVVAIKVLAPQLATTGAARQRFVREARAAAAVSHDHVISIHAVEDQGPVPYLVMQFVDGPTLQEKLDRGGPLPLREVLRIGRQVAAGLAAAHAQGLVHRDVKPANILLENGIERVRLTDFGLARAMDDASVTQSGLIAGTPAYMSPEQANGEPVDPRSDLFSLGSVLYTLCAGHAPFRAGSTMAVLKRVCEEMPRPLREVNPEMPDWLAAIIARLHAKNPAERYQSAAEVAELLGQHLAALQQPSVSLTSYKPEAPARKSRFPTLALRTCVAVLIAVGGVVLYWILWRPQTAPEVPPWKPRPLLTLEELAKLPSPLDALKREAMELPGDAPPELLAVLGDFPRFALPYRAGTHFMAQTRDGRLLAVPHGGYVHLFEADTGRLLRTLTGHTSRAYRPDFSPDGKRLASGEDLFLVRVWDVATGRVELTLEGHKHPVWCVAWDREGKRLVSADASGMVRVWDAEGQLVKDFQAHGGWINQIAFSPDGKRLATSSNDGSCKVWDADNNWQEIRRLSDNGPGFFAVAWSRDGKLLAAGGEDRVIVWNADTYEELHTLKTPGVCLLAFRPEGHTLFTARNDGQGGEGYAFTRWDTANAAQRGTCTLPTRGGGPAFFQLSPDGRTVFVALHDPVHPQLQAYDAQTGQERSPLHRHRSTVRTVAFSPDGRTLASGGEDHKVRLWDLARWRPGEPSPPVRVLEGHTDGVWSVAFSPDGKLLASGADDGLILLWDVAGGRKVRELNGHSPAQAHLTFSPDGRTVAAGGKDGTVNRWDVDTGEPKEPWRWHVGEVRPVAYSPDGRLLASGGKDGTVQLLDTATGRRLHGFRGSSFFTNLAFSPDGRTLAAVNEAPNATLRFWDIETKQGRGALTGLTGHILGLSYHPGGKLAATASLDGTVRLWGAAPESRAVRTFDLRTAAYCAAFSPEGRYLAAGLENGTIAILRVPASPPEYVPGPAAKLPTPADLARRTAAADALKREDIPEELLKMAGRGDKDKAPPELVAVFGEDRHALGDARCHLHAVAFSPDGKTLAFGGLDKVIRLIDLATGKTRQELTWNGQPLVSDVYSLAFSPNGKVLACGTEDPGSIVLWDAPTGTELRALAHSDIRVRQLAFSPDGTLLASVGERDGAVVRLWKVATDQPLFTSRMPGQGPNWCAWSVAFSPDGKTLAAGLESGEVSLFDVVSGWRLATLAGHGGRVRWLGFHPDGRSLVVAGSLTDNAVFVWDLATRMLRHRLSGHGSEVLSGAWRADGQLLITAGSTDGTVRLWDLSSDRPRSKALAVIPPNVQWLHGMALSPEGRHVAVCNPNGTVYVLRLAPPGGVFQVPADAAK